MIERMLPTARVVDPPAEVEQVAGRRKVRAVYDLRGNDILRLRTSRGEHLVRVTYVEEVPARDRDGYPGGLTIYTVAADG